MRRRGPGRSRARWAVGGLARLGALFVVVAVLGACELRAEISIDVRDDGSGVVEVAVGLDDDAVARGPDLDQDLALDDLVDAGWTISGPVEEDDRTWIRATHDFGEVGQIGDLVEQVTGADGPFQDFAVVRDDSFAESRWAFTGVVDFADDAEDFADQELDDALEGEGLPDALSVIGDRVGEAVDRTVRFQVGVRLPGDVTSNAPTQAANGAVWHPSVTDPERLDLRATGTVRRTERVVWAWVGAAAGFALVCFVVVRLALWARRRGSRPTS